MSDSPKDDLEKFWSNQVKHYTYANPFLDEKYVETLVIGGHRAGKAAATKQAAKKGPAPGHDLEEKLKRFLARAPVKAVDPFSYLETDPKTPPTRSMPRQQLDYDECSSEHPNPVVDLTCEKEKGHQDLDKKDKHLRGVLTAAGALEDWKW